MDQLPSAAVRAAREIMGRTQEEFAKSLGLSSATAVSDWETRKNACQGPAAKLILKRLEDCCIPVALALVKFVKFPLGWKRGDRRGDMYYFHHPEAGEVELSGKELVIYPRLNEYIQYLCDAERMLSE